MIMSNSDIAQKMHTIGYVILASKISKISLSGKWKISISESTCMILIFHGLKMENLCLANPIILMMEILKSFLKGFESSTTVKWDDASQTTYANVSVSGWAILAAYVFLTTGQPISSPAYAY